DPRVGRTPIRSPLSAVVSIAVNTPRHGAMPAAHRVLAAVGMILLAASCSSPAVATWHDASVPGQHRTTPNAPLPGFTLKDPPPVVDHGPRTGHLVALTFDSNMTFAMRAKLASHEVGSYANLKVLDILEQQHVPATFFLTGMWVEQYPAVTRRIAANPDFELANHTYSDRAYAANCYSLPQLPESEMTTEILRTFDIIRRYGGHQTNYFRFPGLCMSRAALAAIAPTHVTVIQGDVVSGDAFATSAQLIVKAVLTRIRAGSIVV